MLLKKSIYLIKAIDSNTRGRVRTYKIGISESPNFRLATIKNSAVKDENNPLLAIVYASKRVVLPLVFERLLHSLFARKRFTHNLFNSGRTEWFKLNAFDAFIIKTIIKLLIIPISTLIEVWVYVSIISMPFLIYFAFF